MDKAKNKSKSKGGGNKTDSIYEKSIWGEHSLVGETLEQNMLSKEMQH